MKNNVEQKKATVGCNVQTKDPYERRYKTLYNYRDAILTIPLHRAGKKRTPVSGQLGPGAAMFQIPSPEDIKLAVLGTTNELIKAFQAAPYAFLYESDLQALLLTKMRSRISAELPIPRTDAGQAPYRLSLVYSEYHQRIDIACIDPWKATEVVRKPHKGFDAYIYGLPILVGIELKYRKMGDKFDFTACLGDLGKLEKLPYVQFSLVLAFLQDSADTEDFLLTLPETWTRTSVNGVFEFGVVHVVTPDEILVLRQRTVA